MCEKFYENRDAKKGLAYTGDALESAVTLMNGKTVVDASAYDITYAGNVQKGASLFVA